MGTKTQKFYFDNFTLILVSDWLAGEIMDTKVFISANTLPTKTVYLCTIAGNTIKHFVRTVKILIKEFQI